MYDPEGEWEGWDKTEQGGGSCDHQLLSSKELTNQESVSGGERPEEGACDEVTCLLGYRVRAEPGGSGVVSGGGEGEAGFSTADGQRGWSYGHKLCPGAHSSGHGRFLYLSERQSYKERERKAFHPLVYSPHG